MDALLIHADGRTQVLSGEPECDTATIVLTQAATAALDEVSSRTGQGWLTEVHQRHEKGHTALFRIDPETWLRVQHGESEPLEQVREWARHLMQSIKPNQGVAPAAASRVTSLSDALNPAMP